MIASVATLVVLLAAGALYHSSMKLPTKPPVARASVILNADGSRLARVGSGSSGTSQGLTAPTGLVVAQVMKELAAHGITGSDIRSKGYTIHTTIDPKAQRDAEDAVAEKLKGQQPDLGASLVAVRPGTGEVVAYYGGRDGTGFDTAASPHPPGSSFAIYPLEAALENDISVKSLWDGSASEEFADRGGDGLVRNADGESCADAGTRNGTDVCTLSAATAMSLNTVYYALAEKIGRSRILLSAKDSGIDTLIPTSGGGCTAPEPIQLQQMTAQQAAETCGIGNEVGSGQNAVTPLDQANGYATIANWQYVASDNENSHAWMCGYVPKLASVVWLGHQPNDGPIYYNNDPSQQMFGSELPSDIWSAFMDAALKDLNIPSQNFPTPTFAGNTSAGQFQTVS